MSSVIAPVVAISHEQQEHLNVSTQGKSVNAIRSFIREGVRVWGARTLDGYDLEGRHICVPCALIMLKGICASPCGWPSPWPPEFTKITFHRHSYQAEQPQSINAIELFN